MKKNYQKILYCMVIFTLLLLLSACGQNTQTEEEFDTEFDNTIMEENFNISDSLEIQSGHTSDVKGDYYYITGRVKNTGNTDITYFEVKCDFLDENDQVLDSDYTNDGLVLKPGEMREFEIMHRYNSEYKRYTLSIGDVS